MFMYFLGWVVAFHYLILGFFFYLQVMKVFKGQLRTSALMCSFAKPTCLFMLEILQTPSFFSAKTPFFCVPWTSTSSTSCEKSYAWEEDLSGVSLDINEIRPPTFLVMKNLHPGALFPGAHLLWVLCRCTQNFIMAWSLPRANIKQVVRTRHVLLQGIFLSFGDTWALMSNLVLCTSYVLLASQPRNPEPAVRQGMWVLLLYFLASFLALSSEKPSSWFPVSLWLRIASFTFCLFLVYHDLRHQAHALCRLANAKNSLYHDDLSWTSDEAQELEEEEEHGSDNTHTQDTSMNTIFEVELQVQRLAQHQIEEYLSTSESEQRETT